MGKEEFSIEIKRYRIEFFRFALSITKNKQDAEDAVSESILNAYEKLDSLRFKSKFKSWFFQILRNECLKILKQKQRQVLTIDGTVPEQSICDTENNEEDLSKYLLNIKEEYREVLTLYYYDEFNIIEISKILRVPVGTVKSRLSRGRHKMKQLLTMDGRCSYENG